MIPRRWRRLRSKNRLHAFEYHAPLRQAAAVLVENRRLAVPTTTADINRLPSSFAIADRSGDKWLLRYSSDRCIRNTLGPYRRDADSRIFRRRSAGTTGLREVVLAYDYATVAKQDTNVLQASFAARSLRVTAKLMARSMSVRVCRTAWQTSQPSCAGIGIRLARPVSPHPEHSNVIGVVEPSASSSCEFPARRLAYD